MTLAKKLRDDLVRLTPLYAVVGVTDLAAAKLRELGTPEEDRSSTEPTTFPQDVERLVRGARRVPGLAFEQAVGTVSTTASTYEDLAGRGRRIAGRVRPEAAPASDVVRGRTVDPTRAAGRRAEGERRRASDRVRAFADRARGVDPTDREARDPDVVEAVDHSARRRGLRSVTTETGPRPAARRRRTPAAAKTAAPGPTRPAVAEPDETTPPVPAGSGLEAGATTSTTRRTPATPRRRPSRTTTSAAADTSSDAAPTARTAATPAEEAAPTAPVRPRRRTTTTARTPAGTTSRPNAGVDPSSGAAPGSEPAASASPKTPAATKSATPSATPKTTTAKRSVTPSKPTASSATGGPGTEASDTPKRPTRNRKATRPVSSPEADIDSPLDPQA